MGELGPSLEAEHTGSDQRLAIDETEGYLPRQDSLQHRDIHRRFLTRGGAELARVQGESLEPQLAPGARVGGREPAQLQVQGFRVAG